MVRVVKTQIDGLVDRLSDIAYEPLPCPACGGGELFFWCALLFQALPQLRFPAPFLTIPLLAFSQTPIERSIGFTIRCGHEIGDSHVNADNRGIWGCLNGNRLIVSKGQPPVLIPFVQGDAAIDLASFAG